MYESGWHIGQVMYFNRTLEEYKVSFEDGSIDFVPEEDIDEIEINKYIDLPNMIIYVFLLYLHFFFSLL